MAKWDECEVYYCKSNGISGNTSSDEHFATNRLANQHSLSNGIAHCGPNVHDPYIYSSDEITSFGSDHTLARICKPHFEPDDCVSRDGHSVNTCAKCHSFSFYTDSKPD